MTITSDIAALCRAIDDGDDGVLPILADALEEAADARAAGLRPIKLWTRSPTKIPQGWAWREVCRGESWGYFPLYPELFARLKGGTRLDDGNLHWMAYPTRSAAYLALAEALSTALEGVSP